MFGLMTKKAHEAAMRPADVKAYEVWSKAIDERNAANAEIEKLRSEYNALNRLYDTRGDLLAKARAEAADLRPDAEAMRKKRRADIIRRQKNRDDAKAWKVRAAAKKGGR